MVYILLGVIFWGLVLSCLYALRPSGSLSKNTVDALSGGHGWYRVVTTATAAITILVYVLVMPLSPNYNGEDSGYRADYELLAESFLDGRLDLDYGDTDPALTAMENPYDPDAREEAGVSYHWDHAFYNGKYYVYFGVVPVVLLFLPFRVLTGMSLPTYAAAQIFIAAFVAGVFFFFILLARKFFRKMPLSVILSLSVAVSSMSTWFLVSEPGIYCTPIASGICMEIWSLYFFGKAGWDSQSAHEVRKYGALGTTFGALAFGCRPSAALANVLIIPMLLLPLIRKSGKDKGLVKTLVILALPYAVIGAALMAYNYARFENPFEFGQSYQLTVADQSQYGDVLSRFGGTAAINGILETFAATAALKDTFPYFAFQGIFVSFPIGIAAILCFLQKRSIGYLRSQKLLTFSLFLVGTVILIVIAQVLSTPYLQERYRSDVYWLVGIFVFTAFGAFLAEFKGKLLRNWGFVITLFAFGTIFQSFLLWAVPWNHNFTLVYPEYLEAFERIMTFGILPAA